MQKPASTAGDPDEDISRMTKDLLLKVAAHNQYFCQKHGVTKVEDADWSAMTSDNFDEFLGCYDPNSTTSTKTTKKAKTAAEEFRRGIKKDTTQFPIFTDPKYFDSWNTGFTVTSNNQGIGPIIEATYVVPRRNQLPQSRIGL